MVSQPSHVGPARYSPRSGRGRDQKILPTSPVSPTRSAKLVQPRVFARLQALFPQSFPFPQSPVLPTGTPSPVLPPPPLPLFLKARIITWNMHDSLPKGDLEELLGSVPLHITRDILDDTDRIRIPGLSMEEGHPYHIIVVAGQECPTPSGIPLGLAANFKHRDAKDREKEKEKHKEKDNEKDERKDQDLLHQTKHILSKHLKHEHTSQARLSGSPRGDLAYDISSSHSPTPTSGWSAVLEDWFANGVGSLQNVKPMVPGIEQTPLTGSSSPLIDGDQTARVLGPDASSPLETQLPETVDVDRKSYNVSAADLDSPPIQNNTKTGPYELLVKERLMGIYTAVYIHRDVRSLVRGISTGAVPAGLIGGRLGNKGGVGISIDLHGTTLLFINAHLAAHEGKVPLRVANLAKIKAELPLESWSSPDDPRTFAEDLTDRFDHSWIFGDLNFRLDISRLHADWLISRKEYSQAFAFDQLHKLMESGDGAFAGFNEADIDFPPTFKYDVLRTLKREKSKPHRNDKEFDVDPEVKDGDRTSDHIPEGAEDDDERGELASLHSSVRTSIPSKDRTGPVEDGSDSDHSSPSFQARAGLLHSPTSGLVTRAARKAKATWSALFKSSRDVSPSTDVPRMRRRISATPHGLPASSIELSRGTKVISEAHTSAPLRRAISAQTPLERQGLEDDHEPLENDKGIYDSSSKRRVPSWCDRILWKTTVEPPEDLPDPEVMVGQEAQAPQSGKRLNRAGQLFLWAIRLRAWRNSVRAGSPPTHSKFQDRPGDPSKTTLSPIVKHPQPDNETPLSSSPGLYQSESSYTSFERSLSASHHQLGLGRSTSPIATRDGGLRRQSMPVSSGSPRRLPTPRRAESDQTAPVSPEHLPPTSSASPRTPASRVASKRWFLNLLSRDHTPSSTPLNNAVTSQSPIPPSYRRGDVLCLTYRSLDDRQMRRLEGRSDHRPVIGTFAIHI